MLRTREVLGVIILCFFSVSTISNLAGLYSIANPQNIVQASGTKGLDYVVVIMMENHNSSSILGSSSSATFMKELANDYSLAEGYTAISHPSLPNYLAILSGSTFGCTTDPNPNSTSCTKAAWSSQNLVDRIEASGRTWRAYMENMPSNCYAHDAIPPSPPSYVVRHDPFAYFGDVAMNPVRCSKVVPAGSTSCVRGASTLAQIQACDSTLLADLNSVSPPNYMWLTPNTCNDMHDCSPVSVGDAYLKQLVPQILTSTVFNSQKAALFITFDEGTQNAKDYVYAVWSGPVVNKNYRSMAYYNHYSFLSTIEAFWGLNSLSSGDAQAKPMLEFFASPPPPIPLQAHFTYSPLTPLTGLVVTFDASASGGTAPYNFTWTFNSTSLMVNAQTINHTFLDAGHYNVSLRVKDSANSIVTVSKIINVTVHPLPLTASFSFTPTYPSAGDNVTFTGRALGGTYPYSYKWNFGNVTMTQGETAFHTYNLSGSYNVMLTVTDNMGKMNSTFQLVNVTTTQFLSSSFSYTPPSPFQSDNVTFTATTVGGDQPYTYSWNMGDGSNMTGPTVHHVYQNSGRFNVTLTTTDNDTTTVTTSRTITVTRASPPPEKTSCWYCLWNFVRWSMPFMILAVVSGALVVSGVVFARTRRKMI